MLSRSLRTFAPVPFALTTLAFGWWGCSAATDTNVFDETSSGTSVASTGTQASGGSAGQGGSSATSGEGGFLIDAGNTDAPIEDGGECAKTVAEAEPIPLDIVILLDRSGSMSGQNWDGSTAALKTFVNDPVSSGINVGIVYFPIDSPPDSNACNYIHYDDLSVPVAPLPMNAPAMVQSIDGEDPGGGSTPTYGALKGALFNATALQDANPTHKVILVFASDGDPNSCPLDQNEIPIIAALAQSALNYNGVQTYVIAVSGANVANLNQIANAGGTNIAYDVTQNIAAFSQKMAEIRSAALACEYIIPPPPDNEELDKDKVNVTYTAGGQGSPVQLPHADNFADCGGQAGWYYDNNATPTQVILCPASCQTVQADATPLVSVVFGCKTEIN
jgi:Mg-chelatase subunit ChlD